MNFQSKILTVVGLLVSPWLAHASTFFFRPEVDYSIPKVTIVDFDKKLGSTTSPQLSVGYLFGDQQNHEVSVSVGYSEFKASSALTGASAADLSDGVATSINAKVRLRVIPDLLNYRYYFGQSTDRVRFYLGSSAGFTFSLGTLDGSIVAPNGSIIPLDGSVKYSKAGFTWGAGTGMTIDISKSFALDLGYRYTDAKLFANVSNLKLSQLYAGLTIKL